MKKQGNVARRHWRKRWRLRRDRRNFLDRGCRNCVRRPSSVPWVRTDRYTYKSVKAIPDRGVEVWLPSRLNFDDNYEATARHFQLLRDAGLGKLRLGRLRFDAIRHVSPGAALVLASEVDRWNQRMGGKLVARHDLWDDEIKRLLCEMGYFELLNLPRPSMDERSNTLTFLKFLRGDSENKDSGKLAKQLRIQIEALVGQQIKRQFLFEGLSEAITNVGQHAYPPGVVDCGRKFWWLSASYNSAEKELTVMFYDQGAGIPQTLRRWKWFEHIKTAFDMWSDSQKIEAAMEYGRSSTNLYERGKGLDNLVNFAKSHASGRLSIFSRRGLYRMVTTGANGMATARREHAKSIGGTLIEWSVRL